MTEKLANRSRADSSIQKLKLRHSQSNASNAVLMAGLLCRRLCLGGFLTLGSLRGFIMVHRGLLFAL